MGKGGGRGEATLEGDKATSYIDTTHLEGFYLLSDTVVRWHLNKAT